MPETPAVVHQTQNKRLAVFLDGTWNVVGDDTNVWRLKSLCAPQDSAGTLQLTYYEKGVSGLFGGLFGDGVDRIITRAYQWLVDHYQRDDEIFIFGFSRGAYTARSLAGFIAKCGLLKAGGALGVNQVYNRYRRSDARTIWDLINAPCGKPPDASPEELLLIKYSLPIHIKFVGVWDTVGDLGVPWFSLEGLRWSATRFHSTQLSDQIDFGFQALALDEHRLAFTPTLWTVKHPSLPGTPSPRPLSSVEQRWFVGAHANVGGGYENDILPQVPLLWLMKKASLHGLAFREDVTLDGNELTAQVTDSYRKFLGGIYRLVSSPYYRPIGAPPRQVRDGKEVNVNETIDASVFARWNANDKYRPPNLADWANRYGVDIARLTNSVQANHPGTSAPD